MKAICLISFGFFSTFCSAQFSLFGDFYIASNTELHIAAPTTYFESGSFLTEHGSGGGVVSFLGSSNWQNANADAHVNGNIKIYTANASGYQLPTGHEGVYQPLGLREVNGTFLQVDYQHRAHSNLSAGTGLLRIFPQQFWNLHAADVQAQVELPWNSFSNLDNFLDAASLEDLALVGYRNNTWEIIPSNLGTASNNTLGSVYNLKKLLI